MKNLTDKQQKIVWCVTWTVIVIMIAFLHLYKLTEIPYGMNADEAGTAYDAYSIANYGVDRYNKSYPVYFINYGDGQNALYTYVTALLIRFFGASKFVVRLGIVLSAFAAALAGFLYAERKWKNRKISLLFLGLYAILPVFVMTQRFGLESHLMLSASILILLTTTRALETGKWQHYLLAGIVSGVSLYTYALIYIVLPVYLFLWLIYGIRLKRIHVRSLFALVVPLAVLAAPLIMVQLINAFSWPEMYIGPVTLTRLPTYRSGELGFQDIFRNLKLMFVNTLFFDDLSYNTVSKYGTMYYISLPFLFVGFGKTVKETCSAVKMRQFDYSVPVLFWLVGEFVMGCLLKGWSTPNTTRMIGIFMIYLYFITGGLFSVWCFLKKVWQKRAFAGILSAVYAALFFSFVSYYFTDFNEEAYPLNWLFFEEYDEVAALLEEHRGESWSLRPTVYPFNYMYYLWSYRIDPYEIRLDVNGHDTFGQDYINEYPAEALPDCNYVVYYTDRSSIDYLTQMGYEPVELTHFFYFISPVEQYDLITEQSEFFSIDRFRVIDNHISFSGWCIDTQTDAPFTRLLVETDTRTVESRKTERKDVAEVYQNEHYLECGFDVSLSTDIFAVSDTFKLTGIRADGSRKTVYCLARREDNFPLT